MDARLLAARVLVCQAALCLLLRVCWSAWQQWDPQEVTRTPLRNNDCVHEGLAYTVVF
jgi:hypothetical protein